jgi:hypothetical protein
MVLQQAFCPVAGTASRQADAGITVQTTINANINSARFLLQVMPSILQFLL